MREIKFRGLSAKGIWVFGLIVKDVPRSTSYYDEFPCRISWHPESGGEANCPVKKGTEGQYTGLKDSAGVEIYEGDIVEVPHDFGPGGFGYRRFSVFFDVDNGYQWQYWLMNESLVVGNVHETPELLTTKGDV